MNQQGAKGYLAGRRHGEYQGSVIVGPPNQSDRGVTPGKLGGLLSNQGMFSIDAM
jgi:hypothetical protein